MACPSSGNGESRTLLWSRAPKRSARRLPPTIDGYDVGEILGEGGMGQVFAATEVSSGREVAIKLLRPELIGNPDAAARFERETLITSALVGCHAVRVFDVGVAASGQPYMTMERLHGSDLGRILDEQGPLPIAQAVFWVRHACEAMIEAHAHGVLHRDLKPSNLFAATTDDGLVLKVLDFGISRTVEERSRLTRTRTTIGTPGYMSPEQARCEKSVDVRSDVWSLGVILYELVTGTLPFERDSATATAIAVCSATPVPPSRHRPDLPRALEAVILRALEKSPNRRYASMAALEAALVDALSAPFVVTLNAEPVSELPPVLRSARRRPGRVLGWVLPLTAFGALGLAAASSASPEANAIAAEAPLRRNVPDLRAAATPIVLVEPRQPPVSTASSRVDSPPAKRKQPTREPVLRTSAFDRHAGAPAAVAAPPPPPPLPTTLPSARRPKFNERH